MSDFDIRIKKTMSAILDLPLESIREDCNKNNIEGWDSLKQMNLLLAIEQNFDIIIPDEDATKITSFAAIRLIVKKYTSL